MDQTADFHYVKLHNAIRAHQAVHNDLLKADEDQRSKGGGSHQQGGGPSLNLQRKRCRRRRQLFEQEIIKLLRQKQQQLSTESQLLTESRQQPQQQKKEAVGVLVAPTKTTTTSSSSSKGTSLYFSIPKQKSVAHLSRSHPASSAASASSSSSSSFPKGGGGGGILVAKKTGGSGTTPEFFIRRQRQPPLLTSSTFARKSKRRKTEGGGGGGSLETTATTSLGTIDLTLKRELATIPHINSFDRGLFIEELQERQTARKTAADLKQALMQNNKNTGAGGGGGGGGEAEVEGEEDLFPSSSQGSSNHSSSLAAMAPLSSASASASAASSPARAGHSEALVVFTGLIEAAAAANSSNPATAENTPLSSACPSPVKMEENLTTTTTTTTAVVSVPAKKYDAAKELFMRALDLVPREEYDELVSSRKNSRKRRTTANPHFSSAALEAKRQTKMEIIAERKNRRQQERAAKASGAIAGAGGAPKDFSKLLPSHSTSARASGTDQDEGGLVGNSLVPSSASSCTSSTSANNNNNGAAASAVVGALSKAGGKKPLFSDHKAKSNFKIENKQVFPGLYLVKRITRGNYPCTLCEEPVQCTLDTVLVCKRCSVFFHLNCATPAFVRSRRAWSEAQGRVGSYDELECPGCGGGGGGTAATNEANAEQQNQSSTKTEVKEGEEADEEEGPKDLVRSLHDLRQYIHSLSHANQVLGSLCLQRENEASQLRHEVAQYESFWAKMSKVLGTSLGTSSNGSSDRINSDDFHSN